MFSSIDIWKTEEYLLWLKKSVREMMIMQWNTRNKSNRYKLLKANEQVGIIYNILRWSLPRLDEIKIVKSTNPHTRQKCNYISYAKKQVDCSSTFGFESKLSK